MSLKAHINQEDSKELIKELSPEDRERVAWGKKGRKDPVFFSEEVLGVKLHDGQKLWIWVTTNTRHDLAGSLGIKMGKWKDLAEFEELLTKLPSFQRNILVPSNRWGKTLCTSVKHIWYNFYKIGTRGSASEKASIKCGTLNLSPHSNQCQAAYEYIISILSSNFIYVIDGKSYRNNCKIGYFLGVPSLQRRQIPFSNNTFFRTVPTGEDQASSLAGTPYLYISYDECAQSLHLKDELPAKIMSRLIDFGGPLDLVSTPEVDKPSHQYFHHIAKLGLEAKEGWWTLLGKITDNVFLDPAQRDQVVESIRMTDPAKYRQVAYGEFVTTGKKMFDSLLVEQLWDRVNPEMPMQGRKYLISVDWGFADTGDPTVIYVLDYEDSPKYRIVYRESIRGGSPFAVLATVKMLQREWNGAVVVHDANALGGTMMRKMMRELEIHSLNDFIANGGNKADLLFRMQLVMSANRQMSVDADGKVIEGNPKFGNLRSFYIPVLEEQMGNYQFNPEKGVSDKKIEQDEVMALGMGIWWLEKKAGHLAVKQLQFNPLASDPKNIFPKTTANTLKVRSITIPENRIF